MMLLGAIACFCREASTGLAICRFDGDDAFYLHGCDSDWNTITDTWHQSLADAQAQAVFEYEGVSDTWQFPTENHQRK